MARRIPTRRRAGLLKGYRGLPKKPRRSLARLLSKRRGVRNSEYPPKLSVIRIENWARKHKRRTGHRAPLERLPPPERRFFRFPATRDRRKYLSFRLLRQAVRVPHRPQDRFLQLQKPAR